MGGHACEVNRVSPATGLAVGGVVLLLRRLHCLLIQRGFVVSVMSSGWHQHQQLQHHHHHKNHQTQTDLLDRHPGHGAGESVQLHHQLLPVERHRGRPGDHPGGNHSHVKERE